MFRCFRIITGRNKDPHISLALGSPLNSRAAGRPTLLYGTECWAVKNQHENNISIAKMTLLLGVCMVEYSDRPNNIHL